MSCFKRKEMKTVRFGKKEAPTPTFFPSLSFLTPISFLILFILFYHIIIMFFIYLKVG